jgi:hypothetical protein
MNPRSLPTLLATILLAPLFPLSAQTPLFTDGPGFGGSKVFSEGRNPLGNPARFDQAAPGWYFTYLDGDQRAQNNQTFLQNSADADQTALTGLLSAPWAQRTRSYGAAGVKDSAILAFTHEDLNSIVAFPDVSPGNFNSTRNATTAMGRRDAVDRLSFGGGGATQGTGFGMNIRVEQWHNGFQTAAVNPVGAQLPWTNLDGSLLGLSTTDQKTLTFGVDAGLVVQLAEGVRVGATVDQLNEKHLWDVYLQPQLRAGLQIDLGSVAKIAVESDLNAVERMPFPIKQKSSSASLTLTASPAVAFVVGVEQRTIGAASVTRAGVTLELKTPSFLLGVGYQFGQETPLRGAALMVN